MKNSENLVEIKKVACCQTVTIRMLLLNLYFFAKYTRIFLINSKFTLSIAILISFLFSHFKTVLRNMVKVFLLCFVKIINKLLINIHKLKIDCNIAVFVDKNRVNEFT